MDYDQQQQFYKPDLSVYIHKAMPHSYNKIWIHAIWSTKERHPIITNDVEKQIHDLLIKELREMVCPVRIVNGMPDHVHALFLLNPQKSIAEIIKQIKGSSSHLSTSKI